MKILVADDHELVRDTLVAFLEKDEDFAVDMAEDLASAIGMVRNYGPYDLVLLDYSMPGMNGLSGLEKALDATAGQPVAIMSGIAPKDIAQEAIDQGARGFLPKTMSASSLANAIKFMCAGESYIPFKFMTDTVEVDNPLKKKLSEREIEVLSGLCRGLSNKEIARELDLQEVTIKLHVKTLSRKLDARNRTHAAMIAKEASMF